MSIGSKQQAEPAKGTNKTAIPYPNIITQVNKDDESQSKTPKILQLFKCCSFFLKCFVSKKKNFNQLVDSQWPGLLEPQLPEFKGKKTLVLDLDETLVHSTFEPIKNPDLVLPVRIQGMTYKINVILRPGVEDFLAEVGELFEVVVFTASLSEYAEPLVRLLDLTNTISAVLFRQHCTLLNGVYVKDMSIIGRDPKDVILVDNSPNSFLLQPENAYHIKNFFDDKSDRELQRLSAFLNKIVKVDDVRPIENLRQKFEPQYPQKVMKFVKVQQSEEESSLPKKSKSQKTGSAAKNQPMKKKEEPEKPNNFNVETEPDMRNEKEEKLPSNRLKASEKPYNKAKKYEVNYGRAVPLTERVAVNDRLLDQSLESNEDIELPSPKESDNLINHRQAGAYIDNPSNETISQETKNDNPKKQKITPLSKSSSAIFKNINANAELVTVKDPTLEGEHIEEVRFQTGMMNLNSPLGKQVKIEFRHKTDMGS